MDSIEKLARLRIPYRISLILTFIQILFYMIVSTTGSDFLGDFIWNIRVPDHYLEFQHRSLTQCAEECLIRRRCKAFSFSQKMSFCELSLKVENRRTTQTLGEAAGFVTSNIASWPQFYIGKCANHKCSENEKCDTESGRCEISDCGQAPSMPILSKSGHHETGYGILYTCMENLTMVIDGEMKEENEEIIMCNDGKWGNLTSNCVDMSPTTPSSNGPSTRGPEDWITIQSRFDGSEDFNRNWDDYKNGFGNRSGEFWLGNEELFVITSKGQYQLRIELENIDGIKRQANYSNFSVASEKYNYRLTVSGYQGNAADGLRYHSGSEFSTKDKDNDHSGRNCASTYKGGWWYKVCFTVHLNGLYPTESVTKSSANMVWAWTSGFSRFLKSCKMMIRRH